MLQAICHLIGDYLLQNDWMAANKAKYSVKGWVSCFFHCAFYTLPFAIAFNLSIMQLFLIFFSHFLIDKFSLAKYWIMLKNWNKNGYSKDKPIFLSVWLTIIIDNTFHLICNYIILSKL